MRKNAEFRRQLQQQRQWDDPFSNGGQTQTNDPQQENNVDRSSGQTVVAAPEMAATNLEIAPKDSLDELLRQDIIEVQPGGVAAQQQKLQKQQQQLHHQQQQQQAREITATPPLDEARVQAEPTAGSGAQTQENQVDQGLENATQTQEEGGIIWVPSNLDVLLGRGLIQHPGNARFFSLIDAYYPKYEAAKKNAEKEELARQVVHEIQKGKDGVGGGGRFLQQLNTVSDFFEKDHDGGWGIAPNSVAYEKAKQRFRQIRKNQNRKNKNKGKNSGATSGKGGTAAPTALSKRQRSGQSSSLLSVQTKQYDDNCGNCFCGQ